MCNAGRHIQNIDLAAQDVLGLLEGVVRWSCRALGDFVEARGEVCWRVGGLCADAAVKSVSLKSPEDYQTYEWKSATVAFSPFGSGIYSWPAPLTTVRGTSPDTGKAMLADALSNGPNPSDLIDPAYYWQLNDH